MYVGIVIAYIHTTIYVYNIHITIHVYYTHTTIYVYYTCMYYTHMDIIPIWILPTPNTNNHQKSRHI